MREKKQQSWKLRQKSWYQKGFTSKFIFLARKLVKEYLLGNYRIMLLK